MSSIQTQLSRLIEKADDLESKYLMDGFDAFQGWRNDISQAIQEVIFEFNDKVQSPRDVADGIRFLKRTFKID